MSELVDKALKQLMVEEVELSYTSGRSVDWCIHSDLDKKFFNVQN